MSEKRTVAICGAGQMGAAAAVCFARAGFPTVLWARNSAKLPAIRQTMEELERGLNGYGGQQSNVASGIELTSDLNLVDENAGLVIDCIAEVMEEKVALMRAMPRALSRNAIFLTTTSGLSITAMAKESGVGPRLAGAHFWNPPHLMPLVEVVRGEETAPEVMDQTCTILEAIGKIPVHVNKDVPGFIGNRLLHALWREAIYLVQEGIASPADIDRVARLTFGLRMPAVGPLENMDLVGLDLIQRIHQYLLADLCNEEKPLKQLNELVESNRQGMKSECGFYDWCERESTEVIERRNRQIVHQLEFLKEINAI